MERMHQHMNGYRKHDFANALFDMSDQLRLMEQKITTLTDNSIEDDYQECRDELNHIAYMVDKRYKGQGVDNKQLAPSRFTLYDKQKRSS